MQAETTNKRIGDYIMKNYDVNTPIFVRDFYDKFPLVPRGTIRSTIKRLYENKKIEKIDEGVYALPNEGSILRKATVYASDVIKRKYLINDGVTIGYVSGINFSNMLGLTSQTASVETILSNVVLSKMRETEVGGQRVVVGRPKTKVDSYNYRLLQVMDLLNEFEKYSEYDLKSAAPNILKYLTSISLSKNEVEKIVSLYLPLAQVKFYKIGGQNVITSKSR